MTDKDNNIRFDGDNRKYLIVDQINETQVLVKEAYLQDNVETYSEEKYVKDVKNLYTEERETYYMKRTKERKKYHDTLVKKYEKEDKELRVKYKKALGVLKDKIDFLQHIDFDSAPFDQIRSFLLGEYKYFVILGYDPNIQEFDEVMVQGEFYDYGDRYDYKGMKLITLYGKKDLGFSWRLNKYRDGSGTDVEIIPCKTMSAAKGALAEYLNNCEELTKKQVEVINKYLLPVNKELIEAYNTHRLKVAENRLIKAIAEAKAAEDDVAELLRGQNHETNSL